MGDRLLAFDPDPDMRRLLRQAWSAGAAGAPAPTLRVTARAQVCRRELLRGTYRALLLALPLPAHDLAAVLTARELLPMPPLLVLAGAVGGPDAGQAGGVRSIERSAAGFAELRRRLPSWLRARSLGDLATGLDALGGGPREQPALARLAAEVVTRLEALGLRSLFTHIHPHTHRWSLLATSYPRPVARRVERDFLQHPLAAPGEGLARALRAALPEGRSVLYLAEPLEALRAHPPPGPVDQRPTLAALAPRALCLLIPPGDPEPVGLLAITDALEPEEIEALDALAPRLGAHLEQAAALDQLQGQAHALRALQQVSLIVSATLDPEDLLDQLLGLLATVARFDSASVLMVEGRVLRMRAARGYEAFYGHSPIGTALPLASYPGLASLLRSGRALLVADTADDPTWRPSPHAGHVRSWLGVPIQRRGETIGLFSLDSTAPHAFRESHLGVTTAFARQVAVALDNADLLARERQASQRYRLLQELAVLINSTSDVERILDHIVRYTAEALGARRAGVALLSGDQRQLIGASLFDPAGTLSEVAREHWHHRPIELSPTLMQRLGWPLDEPRVLHAEELWGFGDWIESTGARSVLAAPIRREGQMIGLLGVDDPGQRRVFSADEFVLAAAIADHAAIALHNARSIAELRRQSSELSALLHLGVALSQELTAEGVIDLLFEQLDRLLQVESAVVARLQPDRLLHCDMLDQGRRLPPVTTPLSGPSLSGHVIRTGEPLLISNYDAEADRLPVPGLTAGVPTASWLGVPLIARGETLGAVSVQSETPFRFSGDHLRFLRLIANHIAVALDNARLLRTAAHRADELRLVNEIGRFAVSMLDIQQLMREVAPRILHAFHYYAVQILLLEQGRLVPQAAVRTPRGEAITLPRSLPLSQPTIMTTVAARGRPWLVSDVTREPRFLQTPDLPHTRSELAVPLVIGGEVVGVLDVQSDRVDGLGEADLELLQVLAAQIAISFANARLFSEVRTHAAELEARVAARTSEIRSQKERTEAILRSVADAVLVLDLEGQLALTNPVAQGLLDGPQARAVLAQIGRLHAQGGVVSETLELGPNSFQALASPVRLGELAVGTVVVLRDITRLRELDRLKSQFVATVSHELRTPLANIKLYLSLLRKGKPDRREQYFSVLEQETGRLGVMIEDLLDLARLESQTGEEPREAVALDELLEQVLENHRPLLQARMLEAALEIESRPVVPAHRNQLIQVFTNLLSNAMHYTLAGGSIRLRLWRAEQDGRLMAAVAVQDTGLGIPADDLPYIFDRFYRGLQARTSHIPGSGLGLAIVQEIVHRHGGRVEVESQPGHGSTFTVWLPAGQDA